MHRNTKLLLLTWTAGTLDGLSYISGHVFTANMTGNTVLLGMHAVRGETGPALHCMASIAAFAIGCSIAAAWLPDDVAGPQSGRDLALAARAEFPLIAIFAALWILEKASGAWWLGYLTVTLAAIALGIQSVAVRHLKISGVVTTFITGTITAAVTELTRAARTRLRKGEWPGLTHSSQLFAMFFLYLCSAAIAGYLSSRSPVIAAVLPLPPLVPLIFDPGC